jgi:hypothetical protein
LTGSLKSSDGQQQLLAGYNKSWHNIKIFLRWLSRIFSTLDKFYLKNTGTTVYESGFLIFKEHFLIPIAPRIVDLILNLINRHREGEEVPESLIKECINVLIIFILLNFLLASRTNWSQQRNRSHDKSRKK